MPVELCRLMLDRMRGAARKVGHLPPCASGKVSGPGLHEACRWFHAYEACADLDALEMRLEEYLDAFPYCVLEILGEQERRLVPPPPELTNELELIAYLLNRVAARAGLIADKR
ncbi:MAG TPA: hypothetical protein PLY56_10880 [Armatimonadota bacterium]|nr:hypothetical protein [Armatimonadota bacterium]